MPAAADGSRRVSVVLPAPTCAEISRFSVLRSKRHTLRIGRKGLFDGHARCAHLAPKVDRRSKAAVKHRMIIAGRGLHITPARRDPCLMRQLPRGTVTFLFSDIEGSTRLLQELGKTYADALAE